MCHNRKDKEKRWGEIASGLNVSAYRFGRAGVECYCQHESGSAVIQLEFLVNEGALVSTLADDSIHLWNLRQKLPAILHSLKFNRERITFCHLPFQSKWLYVGTERGNIHIVNVESFTLSGYVIMWNKAIELSSKTHPGPVVHISDNPMDEGKLLIGFECGIVVLWDLKSKKADYRYNYDEAIHSVAWHHEGKQFVCSHSDGTLTTWNIRATAKPAQIITPHGKLLPKQTPFQVPQLLEVRMQCELNEVESPEGGGEQASAVSTPGTSSSPQTSLPQSHPSTSSNNSSDGLRDNVPCLKVRSSPLKQSPGYQVELLIQLVWVSGEPPQQITSLAVNSAYGLVAFGNGNGLAVVDYLQKTVLLNVSTAELYGSTDPHHRQPHSPRKTRQPSADTLHKKSCMSGLSNFYSESVKKLRSSYLSLCDGNDASAAPEERCKSPTSGSGSPCNSDEDSKQKFIDKVKSTSKRISKTFANDFAKISRKINMIADQKDDARDNSFSRSRSSSVTSIDRESREVISSFYFCDSLSKKSETLAVPSLWVGTSLGSMLAIAFTVPSTPEQRMQQPVGISFCGPVVRLKGGILRMAQLDASGTLLPHVYESWFEPNTPEEERERPRRRWPTSPPSSQENPDCQYAVVCSEKQAKVVAMPSQNCVYEHNITETSFVLRADVVTMTAGVGIACFCANGHIMTLSLPSLRPLLDMNYLPLTDMRIARTFCFSNQGQALYLTSPTEIQRITYSQETCDNLQEMLGELFTPVETPEAPNRGFFKGLFGGGTQSLDREDLFGEVAAGKASRSLAQHIPGPGGIEGMKGAASGVVGELARARIALDERGQKLGELEERTAAMMGSADSFSKHAHDIMLKYKDKKWYQL
ncbi:syntaxin-binding protein 5-like [Sinocyclocheilus grahami]|uniref:syntaxin-binding protein 5-like n=1 Tax=Sinocyclocheilus grahami TaxID=75366 RepID=UPI0007ACAC44|nr:PREDICTED: syntaxin-binding protein 5-like [Sinocyclocheilus grahami]